MGESSIFAFLALVLGGILGLLIIALVVRASPRRRALRERARFEHVLKHLVACSHRGQSASPDSLGGSLGISQRAVFRLIEKMESAGLLESAAGELRLTAEGERWGLHVVRAHRLWERYFADEANLPVSEIHRAADRAEHHMTAEQLDVLDAHLGHPLTDPHGDPIPTASGEMETVKSTPLTDWPVAEPGTIMHIEDEPEPVFSQIVAEGLHPGQIIRVLRRDRERLLLSDGDQEYRLAPALAASIQVKPVGADVRRRPPEGTPLSELALGQEAEVVAIDEKCRGLSRRRLLDLGLTSGARVRPELHSSFGDTRAFLVRGALIALRPEQAALIRVGVRLDQSRPTP